MKKWRRRDRNRELDREIRDHLELETERHLRDGLPEQEAHRATRLAFGNPTMVREDVREVWGRMWLERLLLDARLAVRLWARTPGFSAIAILTIGLGIGASAALLSQVKAVFWTPLPLPAPHNLRVLAWTSPRHAFVNGPNVLAGPSLGGSATFGTVSYAAYLAMRNTSAAADLACWADLGEARPIILGGQGFGAVQFVSGNYFRTLGVAPALGRMIESHDETATTWAPVAVISHHFWQRAFGGSDDVLKRTLTLNGRPFAIVGVMPTGFFGVDPAVSADVVVPNGAIEVATAVKDPLQNRGLWNSCRVIARIAEGRSEEQLRIDLERAMATAIADSPPSEPYDSPRAWLVSAEYGLSTLRDGIITPLAILTVVVGGLLLAACANIAGLLLARGGARSKEIATRLALGATRGRIVRQLLTESLVLSFAGGVLGLVLASWLSAFGNTFLSQFMPTLFGADRTLGLASVIDGWLLLFIAGLAITSGLLFGTLPAVRATRLDLIAGIRGDARFGRRRFGFTAGQAMVSAQTALAIILLVGAGLFIRTLSNLRSENLGFSTQNLLYARVEPRSGGLAQPQRQQFFEEAVARLRALPGVTAAAASGVAPLGGASAVGIGASNFPVCAPDSGGRGAQPEMVDSNSVTANYFSTMGVSLVHGRDFMPSDGATSEGVRRAGVAAVIVNQAFERTYFPNQFAVGRRVQFGFDCLKPFDSPPIVGVVADSRTDIRSPAAPMLFFPLGGFAGPVTLIVRTAGDPASMIGTVRRALTELNANTPTFSEAPVTDLIERRLRSERLLASLLTLFGVVTISICCLGIYGMLAYAVARRRQEISIRMAIGGRPSDIVKLMVGESLSPVILGMVVGVGVSMLVARSVSTLLFGVSSSDPVTLASAGALVLLVAVAAAALPSRTATRVDPALALRQ